MTNQSIEQINSEIEALAVKKRELEEAAKKKTTEEKEEAAKEEKVQKAKYALSTRTIYFKEIAHHIQSMEPTWKVEVTGRIDDGRFDLPVYHSLYINGHDTWLNFSERRSGGTWDWKTIGVDIQLNGKRWQNRKDKGYDFLGIAMTLVQAEKNIIATAQREANQKANEDAAQKTIEEIEGVEGKQYALKWKFLPSSIPELPVFVKIEISSAMTEEKAIRIGKFLRSEGLL